MNSLRVATYRWVVGGLCSFLGALMLVEPDQSGAPAFRTIQPHLELWGSGFLLAGTALLCVATLSPRRAVEFAAHGTAGGVLLLLASGFASTGAWTGTVVYGTLGLGIKAAAVLPARGAARVRADLLTLIIGCIGLSIGLLMLLGPGQFGLGAYDAIRGSLGLYGLGFVMSGLGVIVVGLIPLRVGGLKPRWTPPGGRHVPATHGQGCNGPSRPGLDCTAG